MGKTSRTVKSHSIRRHRSGFKLQALATYSTDNRSHMNTNTDHSEQCTVHTYKLYDTILCVWEMVTVGCPLINCGKLYSLGGCCSHFYVYSSWVKCNKRYRRLKQVILIENSVHQHQLNFKRFLIQKLVQFHSTPRIFHNVSKRNFHRSQWLERAW